MRGRQKDRRAGGAELGVVRWAAVAAGRVAWSAALCRSVSHRREAVGSPLGSRYRQKEES